MTGVQERAAVIDQWIAKAQVLAVGTGCLEAVEPDLRLAASLHREQKTLSIIGSPNAGKSAFVNRLLGRSVVLVAPIASHSVTRIAPVASAEAEGAVVNGQRYSLPLTAREKRADRSEESAITHIDLFEPWLLELHLQLIEQKALDADQQNSEAALRAALADSDYVVLITSALAPLKRIEVDLLVECARRGLPTVVVVSMLDRLDEEEEAEVEAYVSRRVEMVSSVIDLLLPESLIGAATYDAMLRSIVESLVTRTDVDEFRCKQAIQSLLSAMEIIGQTVEARLSAQRLSVEERTREIVGRRQSLSGLELRWKQFDVDLERRRLEVDEMLRAHLAKNRESLLETLDYELERSADIKTWWNRDLPFRLQRELRTVAAQLSGQMSRRITLDIKWLQDELFQQFKFPMQLVMEPPVDIENVVVARNELRLSDTNMLKIVSRVGTAGSAIAAGTLLATAGIGGVAMAASALTGLAAEQLINWNARKDREKVRQELNHVINQSETAYTREVSLRLREVYGEILQHLQKHYTRWMQAQLQAIEAVSQNPAGRQGDWQAVLQEVDRMKTELKQFEI